MGVLGINYSAEKFGWLRKCDDYLSPVSKEKSLNPKWEIALKVMSYILSCGILPLIAFVGSIIYHESNKFTESPKLISNSSRDNSMVVRKMSMQSPVVTVAFICASLLPRFTIVKHQSSLNGSCTTSSYSFSATSS